MHATMNVNTYSIDEAVAKQLKVNKNWNHRKIIMKCKKIDRLKWNMQVMTMIYRLGKAIKLGVKQVASREGENGIKMERNTV